MFLSEKHYCIILCFHLPMNIELILGNVQGELIKSMHLRRNPTPYLFMYVCIEHFESKESLLNSRCYLGQESHGTYIATHLLTIISKKKISPELCVGKDKDTYHLGNM